MEGHKASRQSWTEDFPSANPHQPANSRENKVHRQHLQRQRVTSESTDRRLAHTASSPAHTISDMLLAAQERGKIAASSQKSVHMGFGTLGKPSGVQASHPCSTPPGTNTHLLRAKLGTAKHQRVPAGAVEVPQPQTADNVYDVLIQKQNASRAAERQRTAARGGSFSSLGIPQTAAQPRPWPLSPQEEAQPSAPADSSSPQFHVQNDHELRSGISGEQPAALTEAEEAELLHKLTTELRGSLLPDVLVIETPAEAERVCRLLMTQYKDRTFACDTEVANIDIKRQSPCGHGEVICFSIFGGEDVHLSSEGDGRKSVVWVDSYCGDTKGEAKALIAAFKPFFESPDVKKVWHNYSFDRHVLGNMGVHCQGFAGDTMHMARLWDSSRRGTKSYSLASLTGDDNLMRGFQGDDARGKLSMKEIFGKRNITKSGLEGKLMVVPAVEDLQTRPELRTGWINYSAFDAKSTLQLYAALHARLSTTPCDMDPSIRVALRIQQGRFSMWDMYQRFWKPFGDLLTDMENQGMLVNREHLAVAQKRALSDQQEAQERFKEWAKSRVPDAEFMNVGSGTQIRQLMFAGVPNNRTDKRETLEMERAFKVPNVAGRIEEGKKAPKKNMAITLFGLWGRNRESPLLPEVYTPSGWPAVSTPVLRSLAGKPGVAKAALDQLRGAVSGNEGEPPLSAVASYAEAEFEDGEQQDEEEWPTNWADIRQAKREGAKPPASLSPDELQEVADKQGFGRFYAAFNGGERGLAACAAVDALCEVGAIDTLLSNFIVPLQEEHIATKNVDGSLGRVHCSLNINTETGRLSARRPNLQNQPALEKDRYKVRQAFTADVAAGNTLVVADYGQLELRLLAHMTNCTSMLRAFQAGGDFHSRTALGMYDHIKEAIDRGECALEWEGPPGQKSLIPLLKDKFGSERRRAKVLNFSIAYGKTAHGLSKDWKVDLNEAQETVNRWYSDRPEVGKWQQEQKKLAETEGYVCTMLGRRRALPDARSPRGKAKGHALRAAINTPIQGSAADVATAAMLAIKACPELREMGWRLLLQVHDEVILEGPKETAERAKELVVQHMEKPFNGQNPLRVALNVDANTADTWYEAK